MQKLTNSWKLGNGGFDLHHELHGKYAKIFNGNLMEVIKYLKSDDLYLSEHCSKLHNFITKVFTSPEITPQCLYFHHNFRIHYKIFLNERFIEETHNFSDTIKKCSLSELLPITNADAKNID